VAIGTDSLASAPDLNVFSELANCGGWRRRCRRLDCWTARRAQGARALGFDADFGTIERGSRRA
jgi:cytosine/adenosine deaminase-related metal-dependent hydrolase